MMVRKQTPYIGSIISDIMGYYMIPGGSTVSAMVQQVFKKRLDAAREILMEEMRNGDKDMWDAAELEEIAAIIYRYGRAAHEGVAKTNLRLLAQVIAGRNFSEPLTADKFLYYADILSSLKLEEITLLGIIVREKAYNAYGAATALKTHFSEQKSEEIFQSLLRTGLVVFYQSISVEDETDWKAGQRYNSQLHTDYHLTSLMEDICRHVSFEASLIPT